MANHETPLKAPPRKWEERHCHFWVARRDDELQTERQGGWVRTREEGREAGGQGGREEG